MWNHLEQGRETWKGATQRTGDDHTTSRLRYYERKIYTTHDIGLHGMASTAATVAISKSDFAVGAASHRIASHRIALIATLSVHRSASAPIFRAFSNARVLRQRTCQKKNHFTVIGLFACHIDGNVNAECALSRSVCISGAGSGMEKEDSPQKTTKLLA